MISKKEAYGRYIKFKTVGSKVMGLHATKGWRVARMYDMMKLVTLPKSLMRHG